ncbi:hypothetical protein ACYOEI_04885 [Singulisphaera rosea]
MSPVDHDPALLAAICLLLTIYRASEMTDAEARRELLSDLKVFLPAGAVDPHTYATILAKWQRAIDEAPQ